MIRFQKTASTYVGIGDVFWLHLSDDQPVKLAFPSKGPSIKYVTLFLANFDSPPPVTHLGPPIFSRPSTKIPDKSPMYKFYLNCSRRILSGLVFVRSPFCHNTSVTTES